MNSMIAIAYRLQPTVSSTLSKINNALLGSG